MQAGSYKRERICMQEGVQSVKCLAIFQDRSAKIIVGILYQPDCTDSEENPEFGEETYIFIDFHWSDKWANSPQLGAKFTPSTLLVMTSN